MEYAIGEILENEDGMKYEVIDIKQMVYEDGSEATSIKLKKLTQ